MSTKLLSVRREVSAVLLLTVFGVAVPVAGQPTIYWSNTLAGSLQRTVVGSGLVEELVEGFVDRPQSLRLDLEQGKLYWSLYAESPSPDNAIIQRANLDGSDLENVVLSSYCNPYCPVSAMTLDAARDSLYWFTWDGTGPLSTHGLYRSGADGSGITLLGTADHVVTDVVLDRGNASMYWIELNFPARVADHAIRRASLSGKDAEEVLLVFDGKPPEEGSLAVDASGGKVYWVTDNRAIRRANLDGTEIEDIVAVQGDPDLASFGDIAVDPVAGKLYWAGTYGGVTTFPVGVLHRSNLDGSNLEALVTLDPGTIGSFALDLTGPVGRDTPLPQAARVRLAPPYPNPARSAAVIAFDLPAAASVSVSLYDVLGRRVRLLDSGFRPAGTHQLVVTTEDLPSGLYVCRLEGRTETVARTLIVGR